MKIQSTSFDNVYLIHEDVHSDDRGIFMETYNELNYTKKSLLFDIESEMAMKDDGTIYTTYFVQDNLSVSKKNVFRGLHYQTDDYGQTKLVRVLKGSVVDFIVCALAHIDLAHVIRFLHSRSIVIQTTNIKCHHWTCWH